MPHSSRTYAANSQSVQLKYKHDFINLYVYSDSLAFRRAEQPEDIGFTYPFILKEMIEGNTGLRVNLLQRGGVGADIKHINKMIDSDAAYFSGAASECSLVILQFGIVDCAPRPFTYRFAPMLESIPKIGPRLFSMLVRNRGYLQNLWSYRLTPKRQFRFGYARLIHKLNKAAVSWVSVGLPLPPLAMEKRSPGFRPSVSEYNELIRNATSNDFCDIENSIIDSERSAYLLPDGHHLTERGHQLYAQLLLDKIMSLLNRASISKLQD